MQILVTEKRKEVSLGAILTEVLRRISNEEDCLGMRESAEVLAVLPESREKEEVQERLDFLLRSLSPFPLEYDHDLVVGKISEYREDLLSQEIEIQGLSPIEENPVNHSSWMRLFADVLKEGDSQRIDQETLEYFSGINGRI